MYQQGNPQMMQGGQMPVNRNMMPSQGQPGMEYASSYYSQYPNQPPPHPPFVQQQVMPQQIHRDEALFKLKRLDEINSNISKISQLLIQFFDELTKDKQQSNRVKQTKIIFEDFLKHLKKIETDLLSEIGHLTMASTGQPHEGSIYGARKDFDLGKMHLNLVIAQLASLRETLDSPTLPQNEDSEEEM
ncbi:mediator of RNA polymerase II transcription subunit 11 [Brachionus plicatilis]|uniref:Mediator of RNA polymerase II transcription subunit 11 n=1 Tax=Brachionus plicatilis TaxID=10195 RepID=A0A3M7T853_BRAPC|nr:mediator of RNA polymerase II transcription subunit 11 [Brachionus plicatilis]